MGVNGVALATVIAQAISALLCLFRLMRMQDLFDLKPCYLKLQRKYTRKIIKLGLPSGITQAIFSMAMIVVQSLTNSFGEMFIAANVIVMRVDGFAMMPNFSFGTAMTTYAGQNVGAKLYDRVKSIYRTSLYLIIGIMALGTVLCLAFPAPLMGLFTDSADTVSAGASALRIICIGFAVSSVSVTTCGALEGLGMGKPSLLISLCRYLLFLLPAAFLLSRILGASGVWFGFPVAEFLTAAISGMLFRKAVRTFF